MATSPEDQNPERHHDHQAERHQRHLLMRLHVAKQIVELNADFVDEFDH